ncbi:hypothetical protein NZK32_01375 [Cyanobium sp. FGCU-52]|nr:hypothetical protein [Cyanobium sp. FGCU52]
MVSDTPSDERSIEAAWQLNPRHFPRRIDLDLSPDVHAMLERTATATGRSISEVALELLSRALFSDQDGLN